MDQILTLEEPIPMSDMSENRQAYGEFVKGPYRRIKVAKQLRELVNVLGIVERGLGLTERTIAQDKVLGQACDTFRNEEYRRYWRNIARSEKLDEGANATIINEEKENGKNKTEAKVGTARQLILDFIRKNHGNLLYILQSAMGEVKIEDQERVQREIEDLLVTQVAYVNGVKNSLLPQTDRLRLDALTIVGNFLLTRSNGFDKLKTQLGDVGTNDEVKFFDQLARVDEELSIANEIDRISSRNRIFLFRRWLSETGRASFEGTDDPVSHKRKKLKIFMTPFYESYTERAKFLHRKENGVGGIIYSGPPGTGKTEMAIEVNRKEGYDSRVVQIHHFSTFVDLIGERVVQVGLDKATSYMQRLMMARKWFSEDILRGLNALKEYYERGIASGKINAPTFEDFMSNYGGNIQLTDNEQLPMEGFYDIKDQRAILRFIKYLDRQIAGATLGKETGSDMDDWVNGEILIAIEQKKRVVLDELDKAGQYSLGGLLTLLSRSSGETFTVGEKTVEIPSWFKIDATVNQMTLGSAQKREDGGKTKEYLYDRFSTLSVGYPPVKDSLMIAAVKLSDREGNILLSEREQEQVVGIFTYIVPELRKLYDAEKDVSPVTHRVIQDLSSFLVDPQTRRRTTVSVEKALHMALQENRAIGGKEGGAEAIERILKDYSRMYQQPAEVFKRPLRLSRKPSRAEVVDDALKRILTAPMMIAATGSEVMELPYQEDVGYSLVELTPEQMDEISRNQEAGAKAEDMTGMGFSEYLQVSKDGRSIQAVLASRDDQPVMWSNSFAIDKQDRPPQVQQVSDDGRVLIVKTSENGDERLKVFHLWQNDPTTLISSLVDEPGTHLEVTKDGAHLFEQKGNEVLIARTFDIYDKARQQHKPRESFKSFCEGRNFRLSPDGRFIIVENLTGDRTRLYEVDRLEHLITNNNKATLIPNCILPGIGYEFVTSGLIINRDKQEGVVIKPKSDLNIWD